MKKLFAFLLILLPQISHAEILRETYNGREMILSVPTSPPTALVVVLHGGMGSADRIESSRSEKGMNLNTIAAKNSFLVAYLNGTPASRFSSRMLAWNAGGGCCGLPSRKEVDDVTYITSTIDHLKSEYDLTRVYGIGHSNGAIMLQRIVCERGVFDAVIPISGPMNLDTTTCPGARGHRILAIQGEYDQNVPPAGGFGTKGISGAQFRAAEESKRILTASGAIYELQYVKADHALDNIEIAIEKSEHQTLPEKAARYFGLVK